MKQDLEKRAKRQFFLIATDYVEYGSHYFTPEEEEKIILYREELKNWDESKIFPELPDFFPKPALYYKLFRK